MWSYGGPDWLRWLSSYRGGRWRMDGWGARHSAKETDEVDEKNRLPCFNICYCYEMPEQREGERRKGWLGKRSVPRYGCRWGTDWLLPNRRWVSGKKIQENNSQPAKILATYSAIYLCKEACKRPIYSSSMHANFIWAKSSFTQLAYHQKPRRNSKKNLLIFKQQTHA